MPEPLVSRRQALRAAAAGGGALGLNFVGFAQPPAAPPAGGTDTGAEFITPETQAAIDRGLATIAACQAEDGSFADANRGSGSVAGITGLCGLALMAAGHQPGRGKYARNVSRAVNFMLRVGAGRTPGYLTAQEGFGGHQSGMYSHGFASLFLAEVCGMMPTADRQKQVRALLEQATAFAVRAQNNQGGWRYNPTPNDADVSVTVAFMMALRAARNAGVFVRKDVIRAGAAYIRGCQVALDGGFSYFKGQGFSAFARSAAAVVGLYSASVPEDEERNARAIDRGLRYLQGFVPGRQFNQREVPQQHYYYGHYYAALAMWTAGGDYWRTWFPAVRDELLARARAGGGNWSDPFNGTAYATAMSLIVLQLPNNYLPILQK